jgi:hypothetical protein
LKRFYLLVPPELGARGRLIVDLAKFYDLCGHSSFLGEFVKNYFLNCLNKLLRCNDVKALLIKLIKV